MRMPCAIGLVAHVGDALDALSLTSSAIFSSSVALLTWYGISVTMIALAVRPLGSSMSSWRAR